MESEIDFPVEVDVETFRGEYLKNPNNLQSKFEFAWALVKSRARSDITEGIDILQALLVEGPNIDDYLYFLAIGSYRVADYRQSEQYITSLLKRHPNNRQADSLKSLIDDKLRRDAAIGFGIGTVAVAAVAFAAIGLVSITRKKK